MESEDEVTKKEPKKHTHEDRSGSGDHRSVLSPYGQPRGHLCPKCQVPRDLNLIRHCVLDLEGPPAFLLF